MTDYEKLLNSEQLDPVLQTEGPVLVLAGAGSGKTRVLTYRISHLVNDLEVDPRNILAITFTNKAAAQMRERLGSLGLDVSQMWICTIHGMCNRMLRIYGDRIGYSRTFSIYTETEKERVLKAIIKDFGIEDEGFLKSVRWHISQAKNEDMSPEDYRREYTGRDDVTDIVRVFLRYEQRLKESNALDFDDLLTKTYHLIRDCEEARDYFCGKFRYIHIDEFQDTNTIQYNMVRLLASKSRNLFAVGDDDQSIYAFRGAKVENVFLFQKDFPDAQVFKLQRNYRSTKKILDAANCVIRNNLSRMDKTLYTENSDGVKIEFNVGYDENAEANYVVNVINSLKTYNGYKYSDFAILLRLNALSRPFEQECMKYNIPTKVFGGFKFFERKEVKDVAAYLRLTVNPFDEESLLRIINVPRRGIGDGAISSLRSLAEQDGTGLYEVIMGIASETRLPKALLGKIQSLAEMLRDLVIQSQVMGLSDFVKYLTEKTGIYAMYDGSDEENRNKQLNIDEFVNSVIEYEKANEGAALPDYLAGISLASDSDEESGEAVTIATVHAVKGLEFKVVFVCGLDETIFPVTKFEDTQTEEERRLMYVAITRAMERLYFTRARSRFMYGERKALLPSSFLAELESVLPLVKEARSASRGEDGYGEESRWGSRSEGGSRWGSRGEGGGSGSFAPNSAAFKTITSNFGSKTAPSNSGKDYSAYQAGKKVGHKKFGEGVIVAIKGSSCDVAFKGVGVKTLSLEFAPLTLL